MNLLGKQDTPTSDKREILTTESSVVEKQKAKKALYQKENRKVHLENWNKAKAEIDKLDEEGLLKYLDETLAEANVARVGLHSMKVNPHEYAILKLALMATGMKSSKDLYFSYLRKVITNRTYES